MTHNNNKFKYYSLHQAVRNNLLLSLGYLSFVFNIQAKLALGCMRCDWQFSHLAAAAAAAAADM